MTSKQLLGRNDAVLPQSQWPAMLLLLLLLLLLTVKQTRVGSPEATASLLRSPQGGEWIIAVVNQKTYGDAWGEF